MILPAPIQDLINAFSRLPGIGPKTASRLTFYLLTASDDLSQDLASALSSLKTNTANCQTCFNITNAGQTQCEICANEDRDQEVLCVVEEPLDVLAIERTQGFLGRYHVLRGVLSPIEGIGPDSLKIRELITRVSEGNIREIILATNPSMEGDATAMYLRQQLAPLGVHITRLARGLPVGGDLEYADQHTLLRALSGRQEMES
ncbi:MAG: recombination mediator RecR [Anaerolineales bacterium]|jgi:recombination protein RecR|nr:recombination mediator RecR [Anaerolineales bacterium]HUV26207.1 recombination mediator RecR [Anaerolineales bacterium]